MYARSLFFMMASLFMVFSAFAEQVGYVDTTFRVMGANDKVIIERFKDPIVNGVTCWLSRPKKGGVSGSLGLAEDASNGSIACRQTGPISTTDLTKLQAATGGEDGQDAFEAKTSVFFKAMHVTRFWDEKENTLVYLTWSDKLVDGSPKNSISTVVIMPWAK